MFFSSRDSVIIISACLDMLNTLFHENCSFLSFLNFKFLSIEEPFRPRMVRASVHVCQQGSQVSRTVGDDRDISHNRKKTIVMRKVPLKSFDPSVILNAEGEYVVSSCRMFLLS